jgi:hypothetical protein
MYDNTKSEIDKNANIYKISAYLFCRHLEQNGLYDYQSITDATNFDESDKGFVGRFREQNKVLRRSGAAELLNIELDTIGFVDYLIDLGIIMRDGNDLALKTGYWRGILKEDFGEMDIFHEGYYSIDEKYWS